MHFPFKIPERYGVEFERLEGGQGYVYVGRDKYLDRMVAIKVMQDSGNDTALVKEIQHLSAIQSRHVAEIYDVVIARQSKAIGLVQEFVPGVDIADAAVNSDPSTKKLILWQIASGLTDIHEHQIIHRDIKPQNIKFDAEGVIKILDFGLSSESDVETIRARGTRGYIAPELFGTSPVRISSAIDVYSFGALAWYLLSGGSLQAGMIQIPPGLSIPIQSFDKIDPAIDPDLVKVLDATLSINPLLRPSIAVVKTSLERHILFGKHRLTMSHVGGVTTINKPGQDVALKVGSSSIGIRYDGFDFIVSRVVGDVYVNNATVGVGDILPISSVLTFGARELGPSRTFLPVDMSHPGIVI